MNKYDALKVLGVTEKTINEEIVKAAYRQVSLKFHPDRNLAGHQMMILINEAREALKEAVYPFEYKSEEGYNYGEEINEALNKIIHLQGIVIEICGAWVWASGNTKEHWTLLKEAGFLFSAPKQMVYFRPQYAKSRYSNISLTVYQWSKFELNTARIISKHNHLVTLRLALRSRFLERVNI